MRKLRTILLWLLVVVMIGALGITVRGFDWLRGATPLPRVPAGHAEIAFLLPATSGDTWERLVAAADLLVRDWPTLGHGPALKLDKSRAFAELTADVAELALWLEGAEDAKLWIRWYKLSSERNETWWVEALNERGQPPLAVIGGSTTDQALALALALENARRTWSGPAPVLLMTTATADRFYKPGARANVDLTDENLPQLIKVYPERSFRFSFTNKHMAEVVLDFVHKHPEVFLPTPRRMAALYGGGVGSMVAPGWGWPGGTATVAYLEMPMLHAQAWADDRYSVDLADRFVKVFQETTGSRQIEANTIDYSTGDAFNPNPREAVAVGLYYRNGGTTRDQRQVLALPTAYQRAQRYLRTLVRRSPTKVRNLVVVNGDAISFNSIYRDRNTAWNIQDVPVPLVFFAHRNPTDPRAGFRPGRGDQTDAGCSATDDVLLYRDILEVLVLAAYQGRQLVSNSDQLQERLWQARWNDGRIVLDQRANGNGLPLFDASGNRAYRTGEHVVWLKPTPDPGTDLAEATITVWQLGPDSVWVRVGVPLRVDYDGSGRLRGDD